MLRIKRLKKQAVVSFREKESIISPSFRLGLFFALAFHLTLFSVFRVGTLILPHSPLPMREPATVDVDLQSLAHVVDVIPPFCVHTDVPNLPPPSFYLPDHLNYGECPPLPLDFGSCEQTIEYEALEIDFNDDQD